MLTNRFMMRKKVLAQSTKQMGTLPGIIISIMESCLLKCRNSTASGSRGMASPLLCLMPRRPIDRPAGFFADCQDQF